MLADTLAARLRPGTLACFGALLLAAGALPGAAQAQSQPCPGASAPNGKVFGKRFGRLMGAAGLAAVSGRKAAARAAGDAAARDVVDSARENGVAEAAAAACDEGKSPKKDNDLARPAKASSNEARSQGAYARPSLMPVPEEIKAQKEAFDAFGKVDCTDCEGGYAFDSWARRHFASELRGEYNGWAKKLGAMKPGEKLNWQGAESYGTIAVRAEERIGGFDCKIYDWTLEKGTAKAQREGLLCWGKASEYSANDSWVEVY